MCPIITHFKILSFFSPYFVDMQFYYKSCQCKLAAQFCKTILLLSILIIGFNPTNVLNRIVMQLVNIF